MPLAFLSAQDPFGREIGHGRVVLMHGADHDALRVGAGRSREHVLPPLERLVADFAPVHGHEHHRLARAKQHQSMRLQRIGDALGQPGPAHHAVAQRDGDIGGERGQAESSWRLVWTGRSRFCEKPDSRPPAASSRTGGSERILRQKRHARF